MLARKDIPQLLLRDRLDQSLDVSGTFNNCFFHCYSAHLLLNQRPLPDDLFTFKSISGNASWASQLQSLFPNIDALNLFERYATIEHGARPPLDGLYLVEKTLILGVLFREWFATELLKNDRHRDEMLTNIENGTGVLYLLNYYKESVTKGDIDKQIHQDGSILYQSNAKFLDYLIARQCSKNEPNGRYEHYFLPTHINEEQGIAAYWRAEGYALYCQLIASPMTKLAPTDVMPILHQTLHQLITIYDNVGRVILSVIEGKVPSLELKLNGLIGHYFLLKQSTNGALLDGYQWKQTSLTSLIMPSLL